MWRLPASSIYIRLGGGCGLVRDFLSPRIDALKDGGRSFHRNEGPMTKRNAAPWGDMVDLLLRGDTGAPNARNARPCSPRLRREYSRAQNGGGRERSLS